MSPATLTDFPRRLMSAFAGVSGLLLAIGTGITANAASAIPPGVPSLQSIERLPLQFEANRGQADSSFAFAARGRNHAIYLGPTEAVVVLHPGQTERALPKSRRAENPGAAVLRISLRGATPGRLRGEDTLPGKANYFIGSNPDEWHADIPTYRRVSCAAVYPGIDLVYYGNGAQFEYDFVVAPGAKPANIALRFDGADRLEIDARGDLLIHVGREVLRQHKPVAHQTIGGRRSEVAASFRMAGKDNVVFDLGKYDDRHPLVIDPVLSYSTFFGGIYNDAGWAIAVDSAGGAYLAGTTLSSVLLPPDKRPGTNVVQPVFAGAGGVNGDGFVAKLNPAGTAFEYVTYLGGRNNDAIFGIAVDGGGNAYVTGYTDSVALYRATNEVCETTCTNSVCGPPVCRKKVEKVGSLVPITITNQVTIRTNLTETNVIVKTTVTRLLGSAVLDAGFPVVNAYQPLNGGTNDPLVNKPFTDAFISKLDPTGSALIYSTYLGGSGSEAGYGIAVDAAGRAHVTGYTDSGIVFHATNETCTLTCTNDFSTGVTNRECGDTKCVTNRVFVGSVLPLVIFTNYFDVVSNGMVIKTIETISVTRTLGATQVNVVAFPTVNAVQRNNGGISSFVQNGRLNFAGSDDGFVTTLSADGSSLVYSTYLGGVFDELASGIAVGPGGGAVVCGWTVSPDFPLANPLQPVLFGVPDAFVTKFDPTGQSLVYSTFLGGTEGDFGNRVALDTDGNAYVVGSKRGNSFPSTPAALNTGGIFRSGDAGLNWSYSGEGIEHPLVQAIVIDPATPTTLYAGTQRGVFKSIDGGANWQRRIDGIFTPIVNALAIHPAAPAVIYAGTSGSFYRSVDGGLSWDALNAGLLNTFVLSIALEPGMPGTISCGTRGGIFKTTNAAMSWFGSSEGLGTAQINALIIDRLNPAIHYAATETGIYKSTNGGARWRASNKGLSGTRVKALVIHPVIPQLLYAGTTRGFFRSTNGAASWENLTNGLGKPYVTALVNNPLDPAIIFAGTTNGVFRSLDAGNSWAVATNGLFPRNVASLALDASTLPATLLAGMYGTNSFGGTNDVFIVKLLPDGSAFDYAAVFGGENAEQGWDVAVDAIGGAAIVGQTMSFRFPITNAPSAKEASLGGRSDAFITRLPPDASRMEYSFFLGGGGNDYGYGVAFDPAANAYVAGTTFSGLFPLTNAVQPKIAGASDAFLTKISSPPSPAVARVVDRVIVYWPAGATGFDLEACEADGGSWFRVPEQPFVDQGRNIVILPASTTYRFLRLNRR